MSTLEHIYQQSVSKVIGLCFRRKGVNVSGGITSTVIGGSDPVRMLVVMQDLHILRRILFALLARILFWDKIFSKLGEKEAQMTS